MNISWTKVGESIKKYIASNATIICIMLETTTTANLEIDLVHLKKLILMHIEVY